MPATKVSSSITRQIFKGSLISAKFGERCFRAEIPLDEEVKAETPTVVLCVPGEELSEGFVFRITETVPEVVTLEWLSGVLTTALGAYAKGRDGASPQSGSSIGKAWLGAAATAILRLSPLP